MLLYATCNWIGVKVGGGTTRRAPTRWCWARARPQTQTFTAALDDSNKKLVQIIKSRENALQEMPSGYESPLLLAQGGGG